MLVSGRRVVLQAGRIGEPYEVMGAVAHSPTSIASKALERARSDTGSATTSPRDSAERLSQVLSRTAEVFEKSAALADDHAQRRAKAGQSSEAEQERRVAERARQAAARARSHAAEASDRARR